MYRHLNSVNHSSFDICVSAAIHCDGYRLLGCGVVHTCRHLHSQATNNSTFTVGVKKLIWKQNVCKTVLPNYTGSRSNKL